LPLACPLVIGILDAFDSVLRRNAILQLREMENSKAKNTKAKVLNGVELSASSCVHVAPLASPW